MSQRLVLPTLVYLAFFACLGHAFRASLPRPEAKISKTSTETPAPIQSSSSENRLSRPKYRGTNPTPADWMEFNWRNTSNSQSHLKLKNLTAVPMACRISLTSGNNVYFQPPLPLVVSLAGLESKIACKANNIDRYQPSRWDTHYEYFLGKPNRAHQPEAPYRLPYRSGISAYLLSAPTNQQLPIPYLFRLPEDSEVLAARAGKVVYTEHRYDQSGMGPEFERRLNQVLVLHNDGTLGCYRHLGAQDVVVNVGQSIQAGQLIGYSGQTGQVNTPALGFYVTSLSGAPAYQYQKLSFDLDRSGRGQQLEPLQSYLAP